VVVECFVPRKLLGVCFDGDGVVVVVVVAKKERIFLFFVVFVLFGALCPRLFFAGSVPLSLSLFPCFLREHKICHSSLLALFH
jgi:hypothetical protein